jgi:hypothetical protein
MTTPPAVEPFRFETSYDTRDVRPEIKSATRSRLGPTEDQFFVAFAVIGIACLFWRYTIALGATILAVTTFLWAMRERSREIGKRYARLAEPPTVVRIRVTEAGYSIRGDDFFAESAWNRVINGLEMNGYLLIQSWRMPRVYLPIEELKQAGVYERVREILDVRGAKRQALLAEVKATKTSAAVTSL